MKIKRIFSFAIVVALLCAFAIGVAACGGSPTIKVNDEFLGTSDSQYAVDGMSAYDLIMEAYANWCDDDGYVRREQFVFTAEICDRRDAQHRSFAQGGRAAYLFSGSDPRHR